MGIHVIRVPDIGEGIAETEIAEWLVKPGDLIQEDQPIAAVMTDKATVEIPSPVAGKVLACAADTGSVISVGAELIRLEVEGVGNVSDTDATAPRTAAPPIAKADTAVTVAGGETTPEPTETKPVSKPAPASAKKPRSAPSAPKGAPLAAPSVRALAREKGIDLRHVLGTGPEERILQADVEGFDPSAMYVSGPQPDLGVTEEKVIGLRKRIAQRMEAANQAPHITIVDEVDATAVEMLRQKLNERAKSKPGATKLTLLPFVSRAIVVAVREQPEMNAHYDVAAGTVQKFGGVHIGIAAQTPSGLVVPVLRHAEALGLNDTAAEITRLAEAARSGKASREELSGSTITITSLGALGAIATTPILNVPEVAIVGINRMAVRPFWNGTAFEPRKMMNISCSFDHRIIDGWDAAVFVQRLKELLESPALLFVEN